MNCPDCSSGHTEILESRLCHNGSRRRRHECQTCGSRWTTWEGERPAKGSTGKPRKRTTRAKRGPLTPEQVRRVLLAPKDVNNAELARELGVGRETIRQIRLGMIYAHVHPEIARLGAPVEVPPAEDGPSCYGCVHWREGCTFGFPDWREIGPAFAAECHLYAACPRTQSISLACPSSVQ